MLKKLENYQQNSDVFKGYFCPANLKVRFNGDKDIVITNAGNYGIQIDKTLLKQLITDLIGIYENLSNVQKSRP